MKKQQRIKMNIKKTKTAINGLGRMRPGSLSHQARARGQEYCQLSFSHNGKGPELSKTGLFDRINTQVQFPFFRQVQWTFLVLHHSALPSR